MPDRSTKLELRTITNIFLRNLISSHSLVIVILILSTSLGTAKETGAWREAFQSSPATFDPVPPESFARIAEQYKIPVKLLEDNLNPKEASGSLRFRFAVSFGGSQILIRLSNEEGKTPLSVAAASIGMAVKGFEAQPGTLKQLTFGGRHDATIQAGTLVVSDPIDLETAAGTELLATVFIPAKLILDPRGGGLVAVGDHDQTLQATMAPVTIMSGRPLITGAEVFSTKPPRVIVTLGDSITDGNRTNLSSPRSWPAILAQRLAARKNGPPFSVVNAGIGGNRVLAGEWGPAALARFDRDVLRIEGVSYVVLLEGTNDIGFSGHSLFGDHPVISADDLIAGYRQLIVRAHDRGIKIILGTITPFGGAGSDSPERRQVRDLVNTWIRKSGEPDAVIDFDLVARDPDIPQNMRKEFKSPDHLHPGDMGYKMMGDSIDLSLFK